jgi:hypothetical protein
VDAQINVTTLLPQMQRSNHRSRLPNLINPTVGVMIGAKRCHSQVFFAKDATPGATFKLLTR